MQQSYPHVGHAGPQNLSTKLFTSMKRMVFCTVCNRRHGAPFSYPAELEAHAAELLSSPPPDPDAAIREDLTHLRVYTIDAASTKEVRTR